MIATAVAVKEHFDERMVRPSVCIAAYVPVLASLLNKTGYASDSAENAAAFTRTRSLNWVFPKDCAVRQTILDRYQMTPFRNDDFVRLAAARGADHPCCRCWR